MKKINRREFLKGGVFLGAAVGMNGALGYSRTGIPTFHTRKKAAVIGSGFGGSVAALRLGEVGISTALIERGKYWPYRGPDSFPTIENTEGDGRTTWLDTVDAQTGRISVPKYTGLLERVEGDTTLGLCGAGLGGGSLVYGGVLLKPRRDVFEQVFPNISYDDMSARYYPRVLNMVSGGPIPDDILDSPSYAAMRAFIEDAGAGGLDVSRSDVGFNWNTIRKEIDGELKPAASAGEYLYGCNSDAKNTLDKNYIAMAVKTGYVDVFTLHNVATIRKVGRRNNQYKVYCDVLNELGDVVLRHIIHCEYVFMAAGSCNTSKLLLKAKEQGDLPGINDQVGKHWGTNGDELMGRIISNPTISSVQGGPACIAAYDNSNPIKPVVFMHSPANLNTGLPAPLRLELQLAMSVPDTLGEIHYDAATDKPRISWPKSANALDAEAHFSSLAKLPALNQQNIPGTAVWHPLGGAVMGQACDDFGELYGQPGMFVVDGSLLPGSAGCANPALTIAANAERIMETIIPELVDGRHGKWCRHRHRNG